MLQWALACLKFHLKTVLMIVMLFSQIHNHEFWICIPSQNPVKLFFALRESISHDSSVNCNFFHIKSKTFQWLLNHSYWFFTTASLDIPTSTHERRWFLTVTISLTLYYDNQYYKLWIVVLLQLYGLSGWMFQNTYICFRQSAFFSNDLMKNVKQSFLLGAIRLKSQSRDLKSSVTLVSATKTIFYGVWEGDQMSNLWLRTRRNYTTIVEIVFRWDFKRT